MPAPLPEVVPAEPFRYLTSHRAGHNFVRGAPLYEQAVALQRAHKLGTRIVADLLGVPRPVVAYAMTVRNSRQLSIRIPTDVLDVFERAAAARNMKTGALVNALVRTIGDDDLFDSIFDDGVRTPPA